MRKPLAINGRFRVQGLTGVQRVAEEIVARLGVEHRVLVPPNGLPWALGHPWEQVALPLRAAGSVLWSPCNTGPIAASRHLVTLHDAAVLDHPEWFSSSFAGLYRRLWPQLARRARIVTVSEFSRVRLAERLHVPEQDIAVVPNGVDERFRPASPEEIASVRTAYGLGAGPYFLTLSTLEPRKNLALVLRAWIKARPRLPEAKLVVVGGAARRSIFAAEGMEGLEAAGGVVMAGRAPDSDLPALISGARALVYPSLYEGFGLPVLEAMACGAPAVTTRLGSLPEVGGEAAVYVDPSDEDDLAAQLVRLAEDDALVARLGAEGRARAASFTWDRAARAMEALFDETGR